MATAIFDRLIGMPDAARRTGMSPQTLRAWARAGEVKARNVAGRLWVFDPDDLDRALAERRRGKDQ